MKKRRRIKKRCPFCPDKPYERVYKTYKGLFNHILNDHCLDEDFEHLSAKQFRPDTPRLIKFIRVYEVKYSKYQDYQVKDLSHLKAILEMYLLDRMNPSLRIGDWNLVKERKNS